jgi:hypothetical protein
MWLQQINAMKNTQNPFLNYYWINCVVVYNIMKLNHTALLLVASAKLELKPFMNSLNANGAFMKNCFNQRYKLG